MKDLPPTLLCHPFSTAVQISEEGSALSSLPFSKLHFHISFSFFFRGMWHICISQLCLIRICWLKVNEINSSWWHWVRLPLCLSTRHTVDPLITCSQSHTFVSTNVHFCCLTVIRYFFSFPAKARTFRNLPQIIFQSQVYHFCHGSISAIGAGLAGVWNALLFLLSRCTSPAGSES